MKIWWLRYLGRKIKLTLSTKKDWVSRMNCNGVIFADSYDQCPKRALLRYLFWGGDNRLYLCTILAVSNIVFYFRYTMQIYTLVTVNTLNCNELGSREMITTKTSFLKPHLTQLLSQSNIICTNIWSAKLHWNLNKTHLHKRYVCFWCPSVQGTTKDFSHTSYSKLSNL